MQLKLVTYSLHSSSPDRLSFTIKETPMPKPTGEAFRVINTTKPEHTYRSAVIGCGRMGSTIDDEHIGMPHYP